MKNLKYLFYVILCFILLVNTIYATGEETFSSKYLKQEVNYIISPTFSGIEEFYKKDLNSDDIKEIKNIYDNFNLKSKEIFFQTKCGSKTDLQNLLKDFYVSIDKYIDIDKYSLFTDYMLNNSEIKTQGTCDTKPYIDFKPSYKIVKIQILTDEKIQKVKDKLKKMSDSEVNDISEKIEKLKLTLYENFTKNERNILILEELANLIQNELDNRITDSLLN